MKDTPFGIQNMSTDKALLYVRYQPQTMAASSTLRLVDFAPLQQGLVSKDYQGLTHDLEIHYLISSEGLFDVSVLPLRIGS